MCDDLRNFSTVAVLKNRTTVTLRAVHGDDRGRIIEAFRNLERETVYSRFFAYKNALTEEDLGRIGTIDFVRNVMLVVTIGVGDDETMIGSGSYFAYEGADGETAAEVAFVVEEDYQGLGIAKYLLAQLARIARSRGVVRFEAEVLSKNRAMLKVFDNSGFPACRRIDGGAVHVALDLA